MVDDRRTTDGSVQASNSDRAVGDLLSELSNQFSTLMRQEVALAKTELKEEASKAGKAGGALGAAAFAGYMTVVLLSLAIAAGLAAIIPWGFALLAVAAVWGVIAVVLGLTGKKKAEQVDPSPRATIQTLKDGAEWAKNQP